MHVNSLRLRWMKSSQAEDSEAHAMPIYDLDPTIIHPSPFTTFTLAFLSLF